MTWEYCRIEQTMGMKFVTFITASEISSAQSIKAYAGGGIEQALQKLGCDGWELITVSNDQQIYYFKRPAQS